MKKRIYTLLTVILLVLSTVAAYAHSGRTDANGGHNDNKNASGLGSYHYHCGGNPPHLHQNGICPYAGAAIPSTPAPKPATPTSAPLPVKPITVTIDNVAVEFETSPRLINDRIMVQIRAIGNKPIDI